MNNIEDLVSTFTKEKGSAKYDEHCETSDNTDDLGSLEEFVETVAFRPCNYVDHCMKHGPENSCVSADLVKDVEAFIGVCC